MKTRMLAGRGNSHQAYKTTQYPNGNISMLMKRLSSGQRLIKALTFTGMVGVLGSITLSFADNQPLAPAGPTIAQSDASADATTLKDFRASQEVSFWIHGAHLAVDIRKRADGVLVHRYLSGPFKRSDGNLKELPRWTPEGEKSFHYGAHEHSLANLHDGDVVAVEVDDTDTVIGVHDLQFDIQIGQIPPSGSDAHLLLAGTVSKLKSSFIFFRTPVGVVNVNAKIGIKNAKVGQTMTLHMHQRHIVADLSAPNATTPVRRFVTGPLEFATPDRASVRLWTPDGEQTYPTDRGKAALAGAKEGSPITVELNGQGNVVKVHRPR
jgi:hypothetical protein